MDDTTILGGVLNQLGQTAKQTVKQVVNLPDERPKEAASAEGSSPLRQSDSEASEPKEEKQQWQSNEDRIKFLRDLYGSAESSSEASASANASADKSAVKPEDQKKIMELRNQLHKQVYYDPTFNPVKKQEERPAEKVEKEKKMEALEIEEKDKKKPLPLAVVREQNKTEMFRGASG